MEKTDLNILIEPKLDSIDDLNLNDCVNEKFKLNISSEFFKNSGANIIQEMAFLISAASELVEKYGINLIEKISFEVIQGNNYFFEIAKIQVLRIIWSIISKEYGKQIDNCIITAKPSTKNKTIENYKIQSVMLYQAFWHKKFNLGSIILLTAGGMSYITTCNYEILKKITNNVMYRVETSKKRWM